MRGEQSVCMTDHSTLYGSSPYAWGTGSGAIARHVGWRIIPVCVGNRQLATVQYAPTTDHPRMRGEQFGVTAVKGDQVGSSPYAWGTQFLPPGIDLEARIIPVCVGNRDRGRAERKAISDHPRTCGKQGFGGARTAWATDHPRTCGEQASYSESPRSAAHERFIPTWGTVAGRKDGNGIGRIIPA